MKGHMMQHKSLMLILAITAILTSSVNVYAQTEESEQDEIEDPTVSISDVDSDFEPNFNFDEDGVGINPDLNLDSDLNVDVGGENDVKINPDFDFKNGGFDADLKGSYSENLKIGGENGLEVNPNINFRGGKLSIDPKIDKKKFVKSVVDKAIGDLTFFAVDKLGAGNFILELNQDLSKMAGDIGTFLGLKQSEPDKGDLGIPNLQEARIVLYEDPELSQFNDIFGSQTGSNYTGKDELYQEYLRQLTQEYSENTALSLEGQSKLQAKVDSANASAAQSMTIAEDSSNQDVSQNLMRNVSNQMAIQQQIDAMAMSEMQDAKVDRSLALQLESENLIEASKANLRSKRASSGVNSISQSSAFLVTIPGKPSSTDTP